MLGGLWAQQSTWVIWSYGQMGQNAEGAEGSLWLSHSALLTDVDAVEELSQILPGHLQRLVHQRRYTAHNINTSTYIGLLSTSSGYDFKFYRMGGFAPFEGCY